MNNENTSGLVKAERIWSLVLSAVIAVTGICYVIAAAHLFFTGGDTPYSRERVGEYLVKILVPSVLTVVGVIGGGVLAVLAGRRTDGRKSAMDYMRLLKINARTFNIDGASPEGKEKILAERKKRTVIISVAAAISVIALTLATVLAVTVPVHTVEEKNISVVKSMIFILPAALIAVGAVYVGERLCLHSARDELSVIKAERTRDKDSVKAGNAKSVNTLPLLLAVRIALVIAAVVFIVLGIFNGGMEDVWSKAAAICTECIGLG